MGNKVNNNYSWLELIDECVAKCVFSSLPLNSGQDAPLPTHFKASQRSQLLVIIAPCANSCLLPGYLPNGFNTRLIYLLGWSGNCPPLNNKLPPKYLLKIRIIIVLNAVCNVTNYLFVNFSRSPKTDGFQAEQMNQNFLSRQKKFFYFWITNLFINCLFHLQ